MVWIVKHGETGWVYVTDTKKSAMRHIEYCEMVLISGDQYSEIEYGKCTLTKAVLYYSGA